MCRLDGQVLARKSLKVLLQQPLRVILSDLLTRHWFLNAQLTHQSEKKKQKLLLQHNVKKQEKPRSIQLKGSSEFQSKSNFYRPSSMITITCNRTTQENEHEKWTRF